MQQEILDRLAKLMRLAQSTNEHEAALAAARAAELMAKYQIDQAQIRVDGDLSEPEEPLLEEDVDFNWRKVHWKATLVHGLADAFGCRMFNHNAIKDGGRTANAYRVVGRPSALAAVGYLYRYLVAEVERFAAQHPLSRAGKNAFRLGAAIRIAARMRERRAVTLKEAEGTNPGAMVLLRKQDAELEAYLKQNYKLRSGPGARFSDHDAFAAGQAAGNRVVLDGAGLPGARAGLSRPARALPGR